MEVNAVYMYTSAVCVCVCVLVCERVRLKPGMHGWMWHPTEPYLCVLSKAYRLTYA